MYRGGSVLRAEWRSDGTSDDITMVQCDAGAVMMVQCDAAAVTVRCWCNDDMYTVVPV